MTKLQEFQDLVNDINDPDLLDAADALLKEMSEIRNLQEKIEMLEEGLTKGKKATFWFFAVGLEHEQVDLAANTVIGRRRFLQDQAERAKIKEEVNNPKPEEVKEQEDDKIA